MRATEIIRGILDMMDQIEDSKNIKDDGPVTDETPSMIPPLQQQIEILKKTAGIESVYDEETPAKDENKISPANVSIINATISQSPLG